MGDSSETANLAEKDETATDVEVSVVWTDELVTTCENVGGMDNLIDFFFSCMPAFNRIQENQLVGERH